MGARVDPVGGTNTNASLLGAGTNDAATLLLYLPVLVNIALAPYTGIVGDKNVVVAAVGNVGVATNEHAAFQSDSNSGEVNVAVRSRRRPA
ncbi:hypothetical protein ACOJVU_15615 [Mycobacterium sp. THU-M104]|uniref:hypothetical protein n=1 Tax=Mycobacterium sp. THU-M104 TaxID=3410515 RepID=UPI003B9957F0